MSNGGAGAAGLAVATGAGGEASPTAGKLPATNLGLTCISEPALRDITAPHSLNHGELEDVYKLRIDDFEEPQTLEVEYSDGRGGRLREIVFVDPVYAEKRPRICVSVDGIQAMHNAISVLSRKVDNLVGTLKGCRSAYYKELAALREQLHQQAIAFTLGQDYKVRDTTLFDANQFDTRSAAEVQRKVEEATLLLEGKLKNSNEEVKRLEKRLLIFERENGRSAAMRHRSDQDPREVVADLLGVMNIDTLLMVTKQALEELNLARNYIGEVGKKALKEAEAAVRARGGRLTILF